MTEMQPIVCAHGSLARQCRVCELEQEVASLRSELSEATKHANELAHVLSGQTTVESFIAKQGHFDLTIGNTGAALLAQAMIQLFETGGATNFLTFKAVTPKGDYSFTIQKATGITPSEKYAEICADRDRVRSMLEQMQEAKR